MFKALLLAAAIAGTPVVPEYEKQEVKVSVVWYESREELNDAYWGNYVPGGVSGFAVLHENSCTIHAVRPVTVLSNRTTAVGHELLHCFFGIFHK